jgi:hypothetical protein
MWCSTIGWRRQRAAIRDALAERRVWWSVDEWRISTETEQRIESTCGGLVVASTCDGTWRATVPTLDAAARTRALFWSLHVELFYSLGWPSWAAANRLDPDEPEPRMRHARANRYLARLSDAAEAQSADLGRRVHRDDEYFVSRASLDYLSAESRSPTRERAAQFLGVYEQLLADAVVWLGVRVRRIGG